MREVFAENLDRAGAEKARAAAEALIAENDQHAGAWVQLGLSSLMLEDWPTSREASLRALTLPLSGFDTCLTLTRLLWWHGCNTQARSLAELSLNAFGREQRLLALLGLVCCDLGNFDAAEQLYQELLGGWNPDDTPTRADMLLLAGHLGDYPRWIEFQDSRYQTTPTADFQYSHAGDSRLLRPGQELAGKRIAVLREQGVGDLVQFMRFLPRLRRRGAHVTVLCEERFASLLAREGQADEVFPNLKGKLFDHICYLNDLPWILQTTTADLAEEQPYLNPEAGLLSALGSRYREQAGTRPLLGLAWATTRDNRGSQRRNLPLALFEPLLAAGNIFGICLQRGEGFCRETDNLDRNAAAHLFLDREHLDTEDLEVTVAQVAACDAVLCVDTAVAHIAGAMGKPVWNLLPWDCDSRWSRRGDSTPWYTSMHLIRQGIDRDWGPAVTRATEAVLAHLEGL